MYVYRVLVCDLLNAPETYFIVLQVCLHHFVNGVQHLEYRTGCLKLSVAFPTGDYKSGLLCIVLLISWQCVVSSMGAAMCMMCNI